MIECVPDEPVAQLILRERTVVRDVVESLQKAAEDERVVALVARVGAAGVGMAQIQEIRDAILAFRSQDKPAVAYAETFG
jgi:protease-4